jgi:hypothetical protein
MSSRVRDAPDRARLIVFATTTCGRAAVEGGLEFLASIITPKKSKDSSRFSQ